MEIFRDDVASKHYSIFVLSDIHEGNAGHNEAALDMAISYIEEVRKTREIEVILNGDLIDCIEVSDRRFNPVEISERYLIRDLKDLPKKQADYVIGKLEPLRGNITYAVIGNHEESYIREHHFDVYDYYCDAIGCKKVGYFGLIRKSFQSPDGANSSLRLDIGITHGRGGTGWKREGYPVNYCVDIFQKFDIDIGIVGHIHQLMAQPFPMLRLDKNMNMQKKMKWYCAAGCFLDTYIEGSSGYFEGRSGQLSAIGFLEIRVDIAHQGRWDYHCNEVRL